MRGPVSVIDRDEVERRIGPTTETLELLGGGLSNSNIRVGRDRVLRIYRGLDSGSIFRDEAVVGKEATLASRDWQSFRTPKVLARGRDFLVCEYVEHTPLTEAHGAAVGQALAEIHAVTFERVGLLRDDLSIVRPADWTDEFTARAYGRGQLAEVGARLDAKLAARIATFLDTEPLAARNLVDEPVLVHSDFKVSNLHWAGVPLVLDWEFAWAGTRYMDIAQILRWQPSERFMADFAAGYTAHGGMLVDDWRRVAEIVDLGSLIGLYRHPGARDAVGRRIEEIIQPNVDRHSATS
jgi:fructosamine-3-kinase